MPEIGWKSDIFRPLSPRHTLPVRPARRKDIGYFSSALNNFRTPYLQEGE